MSVEYSILQSLHETQALQRWRRQGALKAEDAASATALLGPRPTAAAWAGFVERLALYVGVLLLGAGVVCWVAYNWEDLGRYAKLYSLQVLLIAAAGATLWRDPNTGTGRALLLLAAILLGALFALIGQTYQTGADPWQLFAVWAGLLLPWAFAARWVPLWLLWFCVLNLALYLWIGSGAGGREWWAIMLFSHESAWTAIGIINLTLLALWESIGLRWQRLNGRYGPRLLLTAALVPLTLGALWFVIDFNHSYRAVPALTFWGWAAGITLAGAGYYAWRRDIGALALLCMSVILVVITALARTLLDQSDFVLGWLLLAGALIGMSVAASMWLLRLRRD